MRKNPQQALQKPIADGDAAAPERNTSRDRSLRDDLQKFKRDTILNVAIDIFFEKGYQSTSVDEIAAAMSVTKAIVYWNFSSKLDVLDEIIDRVLTKLSACFDVIDHDRGAAQNLAEVIFVHSSTVLLNQKEVAVYLFERRRASPRLQAMISTQNRLLLDGLVKVLAAGVRNREFQVEDCELVAYGILSMTAMTFDWRWHQDVQRHSPENLGLHFAQQALRLAGYTGKFPFKDGELTLGRSSGPASPAM